MKETEEGTVEKQVFVWKGKYTLVLLLNAFYIILFYLITQHYN